MHNYLFVKGYSQHHFPITVIPYDKSKDKQQNTQQIRVHLYILKLIL